MSKKSVGSTTNSGTATVNYNKEDYSVSFRKADSVLYLKVYMDGAVKVADIIAYKDSVHIKSSFVDISPVYQKLFDDCFLYYLLDDLLVNGLSENPNVPYKVDKIVVKPNNFQYSVNLLCDVNSKFTQLLVSKYVLLNGRIKVKQFAISNEIKVSID